MKRHTLKEFMKHYNPKYIQLFYGVHIINISTNCKGSGALVRTFENEQYYFVSFENNNLILDYVGKKEVITKWITYKCYKVK